MPATSDASHSSVVSNDHIAVFLSPDPASRKAIEAARDEARLLNAEFSAFYFETLDSSSYNAEEKRLLDDLSALATAMGAHFEVIYGTDLVYLVREYCNTHHITHLFLTRPEISDSSLLRFSLAAELTRRLRDVKITSVPGSRSDQLRLMRPKRHKLAQPLRNLIIVLGTLFLATLVCGVLDAAGMDDAVLVPIYLLGVLICSIYTDEFIWSIVAATLAVLTFDFLFVKPLFSLMIATRSQLFIFVITYITSVLGGLIGSQLRRQTRQAQLSSWRTKVLIETTHILQNETDPKDIISTVCQKLVEISARNVVFYPEEGDELGEVMVFPASSTPINGQLLKDEYPTVLYTRDTLSNSGATTTHYSEATYIYMPWQYHDDLFGVIGIKISGQPLGALELMILSSIISEGALSLEHRLHEEQLARIRQQADSELLRSNLLRALSHDIRTPLTAIIGNISNLRVSSEQTTYEEKMELLDRISDDSLTLFNMVENLLTAARFDNNGVPVRKQPEAVDDVIEAGLDLARKTNKSHPITTQLCDELLMCDMDASLITQVISNMVLNAIHHTPDGTPITIRTRKLDGQALIEVIDTGPGVPDEIKPRIFDIFFTGYAGVIDSTHYLGLGLYLCKTIIDAHEGTISVSDNQPKGSIFSFSLPLFDLEAADE